MGLKCQLGKSSVALALVEDLHLVSPAAPRGFQAEKVASPTHAHTGMVAQGEV